MSKLRTQSPCVALVNNFTSDSLLITAPERDLDMVMDTLDNGDAAAAFSRYLLGQLDDIRYNIEEGNIDVKGEYKGVVIGRKAFDYLHDIKSQFNLPRDLKNSINRLKTKHGGFYKRSKLELKELKRVADSFVLNSELKKIKAEIENLDYVITALRESELAKQLEELLNSVYYRLLPVILEYSKQIGKRAFSKTPFGTEKGIFSLSKLQTKILNSKELKSILNMLPDSYKALFFEGFSVTVNDDFTVTVYCKGRSLQNNDDDQRRYVHPFRKDNPHFSDEHNKWFRDNFFTPGEPLKAIMWSKKREEILSQYDDDILYSSSSNKSDHFLLFNETDKVKEIVL